MSVKVPVKSIVASAHSSRRAWSIVFSGPTGSSESVTSLEDDSSESVTSLEEVCSESLSSGESVMVSSEEDGDSSLVSNEESGEEEAPSVTEESDEADGPQPAKASKAAAIGMRSFLLFISFCSFLVG